MSMPMWTNESNKANYFFLMKVDNTTITDSIDFNLVRITLTGCGLSMVGCMLTLLLVCFLPLKSDGLFIVAHQCFSLLLAQLSFIAAENTFPNKVLCKLSTAVLHYFFLCIHFWSLAYSLHLLIKARRLSSKKIRARMIFVLTGWLAPAIIVTLTATLRGDTFGNDALCWLSREHHTRWAFVGPVIFLLIFNSGVMVTMMAFRLVVDFRKDVPTVKKIKHQVMTAISLIPVLSLTWVFGVPSSALNLGFVYIFVLINSSQGIWLFLGHMMGSAQIRRIIFRRPLNENGQMRSEASDRFDLTEDTESSQVEIIPATNVGAGTRKG